ncbi:macrolide family glycosyltransferase [Actinomycetes bacterium KLBMP 9759]
MSRIVMAGMPAAGHLNPSLPLVSELVRRGDAVTYYSAAEFREPVERTGARFRAYPEGTISSQAIAEATRVSSVEVVHRILDATRTLLPVLQDDLRAEPPAAVMFDSNAIWGRMAATSLGRPAISFMTTFLLGNSELRALTPREWLEFLRSTVVGLPAVVAAKRRVVRQFGKQLYPPTPTLPMRGDLTIFPVPRWIQSPDPRLDERCYFVGPTVDTALHDDRLDDELAAHITGPEPVVLVSLGTLHPGSTAFFRTCFDVLGDLQARVVLAIGSHVESAQLGEPPANTLVRPSVPQLAVLPHTAVFVTHGGMNSAMEGLANGVPLVVVPQQIEQLAIGLRTEERHAGVVLRHNLSRRPVPPAELRAAVQRALTDPELTASAQGLARTLAEGGGAVEAADAVHRLLEETGCRHVPG